MYRSIAFYRFKKGINQTALAQQIGTTGTTLGKWENGLTLPSPDFIKGLSDFFKIDLQRFSKEINDFFHLPSEKKRKTIEEIKSLRIKQSREQVKRRRSEDNSRVAQRANSIDYLSVRVNDEITKIINEGMLFGLTKSEIVNEIRQSNPYRKYGNKGPHKAHFPCEKWEVWERETKKRLTRFLGLPSNYLLHDPRRGRFV